MSNQPMTKREVTETCAHMYDDAFNVDKTRLGLYTSYNIEGRELVTALTEEQCVFSTRWLLKQRQEEFTKTENTYNGMVEGKL